MYDCYDCLINYIPKPIKKSAGGVKGQNVSKFSMEVEKKSSKSKIQQQSEENMIKSIRNLFKLKNKMKQLKIE